MATAYLTHAVGRDHEPGPSHPESPARLTAVNEALAGTTFDGLIRLEAPEATGQQLEYIHDGAYVAAILAAVPEVGSRSLDSDTALSPASGEASLRAAGGVCAAIDAVAAGKVDNAFCAMRPPGHHAESIKAMGFCFFNNIAVGARHAQVVHGMERIAVVDFDVHHGNGTQHSFENDATLFYASSHQWPAYPGTGAVSESGVGNIVNVPLDPHAGSIEFRAAYTDVILPALRRFQPDLLLISAGFDAHERDPLAQLKVQTEDFAWLTESLRDIAESLCGGRLVSTLEGGYDLQALAESAAAHVGVLLDSD
ncbi:MAG: histone deacetylase family protein [Pseudomonadota bacterium]|nr:histone deacetylase family protein [Pseudomonadota bacterium]